MRLTLGLAISLLMLTGCAHTAITGDGSMHERIIKGNVGLVGEDISLTLVATSEVPKLSIMGEGNRVVVAEGARVDKIEVVGEENEVVLPMGLKPIYNEIGEENRLKYHP